MNAMATEITSLTIVYSTVYAGTDQRKASPAFVRGIHRWPVISPHKGSVTRKMFPFDDVIMQFDNLFRITLKKPSKLRITGPLWEEATGHQLILSKKGQ